MRVNSPSTNSAPQVPDLPELDKDSRSPALTTPHLQILSSSLLTFLP
ncbi:hypothetical protein A2U01_0091310, partial [Trifolium medium]|nr:hypothetical protein [Trifolium medium]